MTKDDKVLQSLEGFFGKDVVVTVKMDGENTTMYRDYFHARSLDSVSHESQTYVKNLWSSTKHLIPEGWRVCGENLYAVHSIEYSNLESYFMVFSIFNESNICLSWEDTKEWSELLSLSVVPELLVSQFDTINFKKDISIDTEHMEGYVVRNVDSFHYDEFKSNVAKFVRKDHVRSSTHWKNEKLRLNKLKG